MKIQTTSLYNIMLRCYKIFQCPCDINIIVLLWTFAKYLGFVWCQPNIEIQDFTVHKSSKQKFILIYCYNRYYLFCYKLTNFIFNKFVYYSKTYLTQSLWRMQDSSSLWAKFSSCLNLLLKATLIPSPWHSLPALSNLFASLDLFNFAVSTAYFVKQGKVVPVLK